MWADDSPTYLRRIPEVEILRQTWVHQYYIENERVRLRVAADLAPTGNRFDSPYDTEARYGNKRSVTWTGYKVHLTETCDENQVHLITHAITTTAQISDVTQTASIHRALATKALLPSDHMVDAGYVDSNLIVTSRKQYGIELVGPVRPNVSWQAKVPGAYDISQFTVNWKTKRVTCPQGKKSTKNWTPTQDEWGNAVINVKFPRKTCRICPSRALCTRSLNEPRELRLRPKAEYQALQSRRQQQQTTDWKKLYDARSGVEGTLSQAIQVMGLRQARYIGLVKVRLQHLLTAVALNVVRMVTWLHGVPHAKTRTSRFAALAPK